MDTEENQALLFLCIENSLSADAVLRQQAELNLASAEAQPGYGVVLAKIALSPNVPVHIRQMSAVLLKRYVKQHWEEGPNFVSPLAPVQDRPIIRSSLLPGLGDPISRIRTAVGMAVAAIAAYDWPEQWPGLLETVVGSLQTSNPSLVHGSMKCLSLLASEFSNDQMPEIVPVLFPILMEVMASPEVYPTRVRMRAVSIVHTCVEMIGAEAAEEQSISVPVLKGFLPVICQRFVEGLALSTCDVSPESDNTLQTHIMAAVTVLVRDFPLQMKPYVPHIVAAVWNILAGSFKQYEGHMIIGDVSSGTGHRAEDSDGELTGPDILMAQLFEFILTLINVRQYRKLIKPHLTDLVTLAIGYMQMSSEQMESWTFDANIYVAEDDEDNFEFSVRSCAQNLISELQEVFEEDALQAVASAASSQLAASSTAQSQGNKDWWRLREAAIVAIGTVADGFIQSLRGDESRSAKPLFDVNSFVSSVLAVDVAPGVMPFLRGRALWCLSRFAGVLDPQQYTPFIHVVIHALQPNQPAPVRICACKALTKFCPLLDDASAATNMPAALDGLAALLRDASEDTLHLVLETLTVALKRDQPATATAVNALTPLLVKAWMDSADDPLLCVLLVDVLTVMANVPQCVATLHTHLLPVVLHIFAHASSPHAKSSLVQSSVDILCVLVKSVTAPALPQNLIDTAFPALMHLILSTDDATILQNGAQCLSAYVTRASPQLAAWSDGSSTGLDLIVRVVALLLAPPFSSPSGPEASSTDPTDINRAIASSESAAIFVGPLITQLIIKAGQLLGPRVNDILKAVVQRLVTAKMPSFIQSLLLVIARLTAEHPIKVLDFLEQIEYRSPDGSLAPSSLKPVMDIWMKNCDFIGQYGQRINALALSQLLSSKDPRLMSITVQGDLVVDVKAPDGVRTRNKSKKAPDVYQEVPLPLRIFALLVRSLQEANDNALAASDDEEGEDEEDDEEGEEGNSGLDHGLSSHFAPASEYGHLTDFDLWGNDEEEDDLEDMQAIEDDPLAQADIKANITGLIRTLATGDSGGSFSHALSFLSPDDQKTVMAVLNPPHQPS